MEMATRYSFTSESVTEGHPDKVADRISDSILDAATAEDRYSREDCETVLLQGIVVVTGQISTSNRLGYAGIVRSVLRGIGLDNALGYIDWKTCAVLVYAEVQSPDISAGIGKPGRGMGAGDPGIMFGYASGETRKPMPLPIMLSHRMVRRLAQVRRDGTLPYLRPDGKSQVTVDYEDGVPVSASRVVVAAQHTEKVDRSRLSEEIEAEVIRPSIPEEMLSSDALFLVNETGRFVIGGTRADTGITGRRIVADTYGGFGSHGGGCFMGKDPTKVDRSGGYAARYVAKNIFAAGIALRCTVQPAYAIGVSEPVSFTIDITGTGQVVGSLIGGEASAVFDLSQGAVIESLDLHRPIYRDTACYGHFGRDGEKFSWERTDRKRKMEQVLHV